MSVDWELLATLCRRNLECPKKRVKPSLEAILDNLDDIRDLFEKICQVIPRFDLDPQTPANGGRTCIKLAVRCIEEIIAINRKLLRREWGFFDTLADDLEAYTEVLMELQKGLKAIDMGLGMTSEDGNLFLDCTPIEFMKKVNVTIRQRSFFGRCHSFQYNKSLRLPLKVVNIAMVVWHQLWSSKVSFISKCKNIYLCITNVDKRRDLILQTLMRLDVHLIKSLWNSSEAPFLSFFKTLLVPKLQVNLTIPIVPSPMSATTIDGDVVDIPTPSSHVGPKLMQARLLSARRREGMVGYFHPKSKLAARSEALVIQIHGGGFVALSCNSYQKYLHDWAIDFDVPILRIDYGHAPEAPFPRAVEDVLYIYAWVLRHGRDMLGFTLDKIILVGESAGGNLCAALALKTIQLGIRKPDGILLTYAPLNLQCVPSASRIIGFCDPLLPFSILVKCFKAYASLEDAPLSEDQIREFLDDPVKIFEFETPKDPFLSPYIAPEELLREMPPVKLVALEMDFFLDDSVMFAKKLRKLGVKVDLDVLSDLPHAFLSFASVCKEAQDGSELCSRRIQELLT